MTARRRVLGDGGFPGGVHKSVHIVSTFGGIWWYLVVWGKTAASRIIAGIFGHLRGVCGEARIGFANHRLNHLTTPPCTRRAAQAPAGARMPS